MKSIKKDLNIILPIWVIGGIIGFIFEVIFYYFDKGYLINRGSTLGPWIPIYGFGAIFIYLFTKRIKDNKKMVFIISLLICGLLEFLTAYCLYHFGHIRLWDYNTEILNFGNVGGYICLRSVVMWGFSGILLNSYIIPSVNKIYQKYNYKKVFFIWTILASLFMIDFLTYIII